METSNKLLKKYKTRLKGLNTSEVNLRTEKYGLNELEEKEKQNIIIKFLLQFTEILTILLIIASVAAYFIGDNLDAIVILVVVFINAIVGFKQEYKAEKAMDQLKNIIVKKAKVVRNGVKDEINAKNLTIGDIVIIEEGDKVPADLVLIESSNLKVDQSLLTGESRPVNKNAYYNESDDSFNPENEISESSEEKIVFMDTNVVTGRGTGIVYAIGMDTNIGKIASVIQEESSETPLQEKVDKLGKTLGLVAIFVCIFVFILQYFQGIGLVDNFMTAVSLAVAAVPEGLPAVLTLTLALGMQKIAENHGIVRRLLAVETLGSCNIICTDKTGTLTLNRMHVVKDKIYSPMAYNIGHLCNNSTINNGEIIGDHTDGGILEYTQEKVNMDFIKNNERIKEIPLTSSRKRMSVIYKTNSHVIEETKNQIRRLDKNHEQYKNKNNTDTSNNENIISYTKGAPEIVLSKCKYIDDNGTIKILDDETLKNISLIISEMTSNALRVIGLSYKILKSTDDMDNENNIEEDMIFTGLLGMIDPPKKGTKESIQKCQDAGIKVIMITGDHPDTAKAIAKELNILDKGKVITGEELKKLTDEEYSKICYDIEVYARVYPEQKLKIVETLKQHKNIVAMTGDGVNDAPALKKASIGVAMGNGTDVAKESSDMILQNDDFSTIIRAIEEGRKIFDNIKRFVRFQVSTNIGAILTITGASIINIPLPFNPIQILWINIIMDGPPAQSLGNEGAEKNIMERGPENGEILNKKDLLRIFIYGLTMMIGTISLFVYELNNGNSLTKSMTIAFTLFVIYQLFSAICNRADSDEKNRIFTLSILGSFILQILVIYLSPLQVIFRTCAIGITDWIFIFTIAATIFIVEYILRKTIYK